MGAPLSTTCRHARRYCALGILEVTREQVRKGRALKFYWTVADRFFVPNRLRPTPNSAWQATFEKAARRGLEHVYGEQLSTWGELIHRSEAGIFSTSLAQSPEQPLPRLESDAPAYLNAAHDAVYLDFDDAKLLQHELRALLETYAAKAGAQRYLVRLGLTPLPEDVELIS